MAVPKSDGFATDFNMIPGFTSAWPSGNGTVSPFNSPGSAGIIQTDTVTGPGAPEAKTPEQAQKPARKAPRKATTRK